MPIDVIPTGAALGAEIIGLDLRYGLSDDTLSAIKDAWQKYLVLVIRGQGIDDPQLVEFSRHFGDLELAPANEVTNSGNADMPELQPEIAIISNVSVDGKPLGALGNLEAIWHTDMSYIEEPPLGSILYAIEIPKKGGNTGFANMYSAYDTLPPSIKKKIKGLEAIHDFTLTSAGTLRKGFEPVGDVTEAPGARHPLIRTHPETGKSCLFLGRRTNSYILGLSVDESEKLLDSLWDHATQQRFSWHHKWSVGDVVMWDNRCTMHRRDAFDNSDRRIMHRTQVRGDRPYYAVVA